MPRRKAAPPAGFAINMCRDVNDTLEEVKYRRHDDSMYNPADFKNMKYCICRQSSDGYMGRCPACREWFHLRCIDADESVYSRGLVESDCPICSKKGLS